MLFFLYIQGLRTAKLFEQWLSLLASTESLGKLAKQVCHFSFACLLFPYEIFFRFRLFLKKKMFFNTYTNIMFHLSVLVGTLKCWPYIIVQIMMQSKRNDTLLQIHVQNGQELRSKS